MIKIAGGLFLALILSAPGFAQKSKTAPESEPETKSVKKQNDKKIDEKGNGAVLLQSGPAIEAELQQTLDVRKTSVGDEVVLTTTKAIKQNGAVVVQKGSRLIGRVTQVQQKTKDQAQSKIGVVFDRLEGKNLNAPISATIVSIVRSEANASVAETLDSSVSGNATGSGSGSRSSAGGGLLGGVTQTVGSVARTTTNTVGGVTDTARQTLGGTTQSLGRSLNGIRISQSADIAASGTTTLSTNNNLRIEKGVTFQLRLTESIEN